MDHRRSTLMREIVREMRRQQPTISAWMAFTLACFMALTSTAAAAKDPPVPTGTDPGGIAIAIVSSGIDYLKPTISPYLARDGEGQIIGWDFVDDDDTPYHPSSKSRATTSGQDAIDALLVAAASAKIRIRLIPLRINPADVTMRAKALAHAARTPATIVYCPGWSPDATGKRLLAAAGNRAAHMLIVVGQPADMPHKAPASPSSEPATTVFAGRGAPNLIIDAARRFIANPTLKGQQLKLILQTR